MRLFSAETRAAKKVRNFFVLAFETWRVALEQLPRERWDKADEELMMNIQELVKQQHQALIEKGREETLQRNVLKVFVVRHGEVPETLRESVEQCRDLEQLDAWLILVATQSREEVLAQIL